MSVRKELKQKGKASLRKHYLIFAAVCLISAFLASEFKGSLNFSTLQNYEQIRENPESYSAESTVSQRTIGWENVFQDILSNNLEEGRRLSVKIQEEAAKQAEYGNPMFGRTRGVFSNIVNQLTSGSILVTIAAGLNSLTGTENGGIVFLILAGTLGLFVFWFFIQNTFSVILRRIFLEGRTYQKVPISRFLYLLRIKRWMKASWIMLVKYFYHTLWSLTILGAVIKHYSYFLVPYIVAENPDMTARQAITLSRKMMKGHKWECFLFEISFLGWSILGALTLGIFNIFYTNPYKSASFAEYYVLLRRKARKAQLPNADLLNDIYLYEKPDALTLTEKYLDILDVMETPSPLQADLPGIKGFLARNFGILLFWGKQEKAYEHSQAVQIKNQELSDAMKGLVYPTRLYPIPEEEKRIQIESMHIMRQYSICSLLVLFLGLSFFGWLWEVTLHLVTNGDLVNRGALNGPWIPIYGSGAVLILTLLYRLRKNPAAEFFSAMVLCGALEYITSLIMEVLSGGMKWWDYSGYFLNLNGRICAEGLLTFGIGGVTVVYILAPLIDNLLHKADQRIVKILCLVFLTLFCLDLVYSKIHPNAGEGVTDIGLRIPEETQQEDF